jgi:MarR family transcriptional regulator, 2-MHQ and catechol-resistance regulon repressor
MKGYGKRADLALDVWVKLARSFTRFNARTIEHIRHYGLTQAQFGVLECLGHLGPMKCGDLCKKQLVTGGNMTVVLDNLEKLGLVDRTPTPEDRRAFLISLTAKGQTLFDEIFPNHANYIEELMGTLSEEEQTQLAQLLKKLGLSL